MKNFIIGCLAILCVALLGIAFSPDKDTFTRPDAATGVDMQNPVLPTLTRISTNTATGTVEFADSAAKKYLVEPRNTVVPQITGTGVGSKTSFIELPTGRLIATAPNSKFRIVGVGTSDSLKTVALRGGTVLHKP